MKKRLTAEEWKEIFEKAEESAMTEKAWCERNNIHHGSYKTIKWRMKKKGCLGDGGDPACFSEQTDTHLEYRDEEAGRSLYLYREAVDRSNRASLQVIITRVMKKELKSGDVYVFLRSDRKTVRSIRWTGYGFCVADSQREYGTVPWPEKGVPYPKKDMEKILKMIWPN